MEALMFPPEPTTDALCNPTDTPELPLGAAVYSRDGHRLGKVKKVRGGCLMLDVPFAFDYWLSARCVAAVQDGRVALGVDRRGVRNYLVDIDCPEDFEELEPIAAGGPAFSSNVAQL